MLTFASLIIGQRIMNNRTQEEYYMESKRIRNEVLQFDGDIYKPYAIINEQTFNMGRNQLRK